MIRGELVLGFQVNCSIVVEIRHPGALDVSHDWKANKMIFFKTAACLPDNDKARIEFLMDRITEVVGLERIQKDVVDISTLLTNGGEALTLESLVNSLQQHLNIDISDLKIRKELNVLNRSQGGGGG